MATQNFIVATAGHVDHGKSALVKALTGTDPDRLPEEKARGITIDLGFAFLELPSIICDQPSTLHVGIVDVPGHEDFVKNMVAGVGSIDLALFVVAADDTWMPQTEEHLQILTYLGVTRAVVALTKIDLAETEEATLVASVRAQLRDTPFASAPIVPTSVLSGHGLTELKTILARELAQTPPPRDIGKPRLPVDRAFTLKGLGTIVTGTLSGGALQRGQSVVLQPSGQGVRLRSLQTHNCDVERAGPGTRTAVNLPDVQVAERGRGPDSLNGVHRGAVLTLAELGRPCDTLDVLLEKSGRLLHSDSTAARALQQGALVRVHHGSANYAARVRFYEKPALLPGEQALAQLRLESPIFVFVGDRFVVRDWPEQNTLGGGVVLDAEATPKQFRSAAHRKFLQTRASATGDPRVLALSQVVRDRAVRRSALLRKSHHSATEIAQAIAELEAAKSVVLLGDWLMEAAWWKQLLEQAARCIDAEHRTHPERDGLALSELRRALEAELPLPDVFDAILAALGQKDFTQAGAVVRRAAHRANLPPHLEAAGAKLRAALVANPFEPAPRKQLAPEAASQQALRFLLQTGEAIELSEETVLSAQHFHQATEAIKRFLQQRGKATVSELRQVLGTNRRVIVPLLERLDRLGITLRQGDVRVLRKQ